MSAPRFHLLVETSLPRSALLCSSTGTCSSGGIWSRILSKTLRQFREDENAFTFSLNRTNELLAVKRVVTVSDKLESESIRPGFEECFIISKNFKLTKFAESFLYVISSVFTPELLPHRDRISAIFP